MRDPDPVVVSAPIAVEVAYATPERQVIIALQVPTGTTAREAAAISKIADVFPGLDVATAPMGIFSRKIKSDQPLRAGDRVEIYRPLLADPKEVRRQLAAEGKTMGRQRPDDAE